MKKLLLAALLFTTSSLFATNSGYKTRFDREQVIKDVNSQQMEKYENDNFQVISPKILVSKHIITDANQTVNNAVITSANDFLNNVDCSSVLNNAKWTATVYNVNAINGVVSCMVAPVGDLNNPIGVFNIQYPNAKKFFAKDLKQAKIDKANEITTAKTQFDGVYTTIKQKQDDLRAHFEAGQSYLTVPEVLTSVILSDTDKIDVTATRDTGKLEFKNGINISPKSNTIITGAESIFNTYTGLGDVSMQFFVILLAFFGIYGVSHYFLSSSFSQAKETEKIKHIPYLFGLVAGTLLFIPTSSYQGNHGAGQNGKDLAQYDIMDTKFQDFEREGYSLFSDWANQAAAVINDSEMQSIINKSGVGTAEQITNAYAGKQMYNKLYNASKIINDTCNAGYTTSEMYMSNDDTKYKYSDNSSTVFPTSENYGYAMALYNMNPNYYRDLPKENFYSTNVKNAYQNILNSGEDTDAIGHYYYPKMSLAACGKNFFDLQNYEKKYNDYENTLTQLENVGTNDNAKLNAIKGIVEYQYQNFNDWGYMSVLGLITTKMETELIGGLYNNPEDKVITALNNKMAPSITDKISHSLLSSIPYMFIPGIEPIYKTVSKSIGDKGTLFSSIPFVGGVLNGAVKITGDAVGLGVGLLSAKILLNLFPLIFLLALGILRFVLIIAKIFVLHFSALFILPVAFARENLKMVEKFTMKIFATMLELPLFAIAVYIALIMDGFIQNLGNYFGKESIIAMINNANNNIDTVSGGYVMQTISKFGSKMLLYFFDGFVEIAISVIATFVTFKILVSLHNIIMDAIELKGVSTLEKITDSFKSDSSNWGTKI